MANFLVGFIALVSLSVILAWFAKDHRPFVDTNYPFGYAFLAIFAVMTIFILIVRYFARM